MPPLTRILFAGLWTLADRAGRLENRPKRIKAEVLPYDDCNVVTMLFSLQNAGFITCYEVGNLHIIQILKFSEHQNPHKKEVDSVLPGRENPEQAEIKPALAVLIPDSLITDSLNPSSADADVVEDEQVELIRKSYPRSDDAKEGRRAIRKAIEQQRKVQGSRKDAARFLYERALVYRAINAEWPPGERKQFTPLCATWFNKERYNDSDDSYQRAGNHGQANKTKLELVTDKNDQAFRRVADDIARDGEEVPAGTDGT